MSPTDGADARVRIRDAALLRFARDGFGTSVRAIAADAGVSAALVIHHYGSKDALRDACDAYVIEAVGDELAATMRHTNDADLVARLTYADDLAPIVAYLVRSLLTGGALAARLVDGLAEESEKFLREGIADGSVRADIDVPGMARVLVGVDMGQLLLAQVRASAGVGAAPTEDPLGAMAEMARDMRSVIEIYTRGVFTSTALLDAYDAAFAHAPDADPEPTAPQEDA